MLPWRPREDTLVKGAQGGSPQYPRPGFQRASGVNGGSPQYPRFQVPVLEDRELEAWVAPLLRSPLRRWSCVEEGSPGRVPARLPAALAVEPAAYGSLVLPLARHHVSIVLDEEWAPKLSAHTVGFPRP